MNKKKNNKEAVNIDLNRDINEVDPKVIAEARNNMRAEMKDKFDKWITVYDEDATDDDLQKAKQDFNDKVAEYTDKKYEICAAGPGKSVAYAEFLKKFNNQANHWVNGAWKGVLTFDKVITKHIEELTPDKAFEIDYSTLFFLYNAMQQPAGVGVESARAMAELENYDENTGKVREDDTNPVTYSGVLEILYGHMKKLENVDKMLKLYRERMNIAAAGVKFDFKITDLEEFVQFHDTWLVDNVPTEPNQLR